MRISMLLFVLCLAACTTQPTLEELEAEALETGDWDAVEERERQQNVRRERTAPGCPDGQTKMCVELGASNECRCE